MDLSPSLTPEKRERLETQTLAAACGCDTRTAAKWRRGEKVLASIALALEEKAKELGLPLPQQTAEPEPNGEG